MISNFFFKKKSIKINNIFPKTVFKKKFIINDVKPLHLAKHSDLTFFDSIKYKHQAVNSKAGLCITTEKLQSFLPKNTQKIIVQNVLFDLAKVLKEIYPFADLDYPDFKLTKPNKKKNSSVKFGNNVLIGKNVKIGKNSIIGSNTIIESHVSIGKDCVIGSGVILKNSLIHDRVVLQDNCTIGQKGFGFIPSNKKI